MTHFNKAIPKLETSQKKNIYHSQPVLGRVPYKLTITMNNWLHGRLVPFMTSTGREEPKSLSSTLSSLSISQRYEMEPL